MKVAYIGAKDQLSKAFVERMSKEGNDVYFLSVTECHRSIRERLGYRFYKIPMQENTFRKILKSISPDCVVFAGAYLMNSVWQEREEEDVALLARTLRILAEMRETGFILLSSVDVYGNCSGKVDEQRCFMPDSERGIRFVREEQMVDIYRKQYNLNVSVIRSAPLYSDQAEAEGTDFLSRAFADVIRSGTDMKLVDESFQPLHVSDLVDGIKRVMDAVKTGVYNICGSFEISRSRLYEKIGESLDKEAIQHTNADIVWTECQKSAFIENNLVKKELEWTDFRNLETQIEGGEIAFIRERNPEKKKRKKEMPAVVRRTLENVIVFAAFFAAYYACASHSLFSQIEWLTIYVILISVFSGIRQSAVAVLLASGAYLYMQNLSILEMTNFYSYAGSVLKIMEFVFLGLAVSYTTDMLREELRDAKRDLALRTDEYEELKKINDENVMIKNEYEERVLDSKSGFPKLYSVVSRLMVLQPDRIFMEIIQIISEMIRTDTVAVYLVKEDSTYLRLANALNEASVQGGKSWNISEYPEIQNAVRTGELYQGDTWKGEPAIVLPILHQGRCVAVILIKSLPYTSRTLYYVNLLKTLSLLLQEAVGRALDHEELVREELYLEDTDILKPEPFRRNILLAREKAEKHLAGYCVVRITYPGELLEAYRVVSARLRTTDCLGTGEDGALYVLLNNTGAEDVAYLQKRLRECNVTVTVTTAFDDLEEG